MLLTEQDRSCLVWFQLMLSVMIFLSISIGISNESGLFLSIAVMSIACMLYLLRWLLFAYVELIACVSATLFLIGAHDASAELYVRYFTLLGVGDLPYAYNWIYASLEGICIGLGAFYAKRDLL